MDGLLLDLVRDSGFGAGESLVAAYRHYQTVCHGSCRISFDRAFDLASHTDGIWLANCLGHGCFGHRSAAICS